MIEVICVILCTLTTASRMRLMGCVARRLQPTRGEITGACWKKDNRVLAEEVGRRGTGNGQA